jgi:acetyl esterase/lipase
MKTSPLQPPPVNAASMPLSAFQGRHRQQHQRRRQSRSAAVFLKRLGVPIVLLLGLFRLGSSSDPMILTLWNGRAPIGDHMYEDADTTITVYLAEGDRMDNNATKASSSASASSAVIICPGGGYSHLSTQREGHLVARWLNTHGITAVVLEYRLPYGRSSVPASDAHRAIRTVRSNAVAWQVDPSRIGIMGFSAGGHVAATVGTHFDLGNPEAVHLVDRASCRPDFVLLAYPVVTMGENAHVISKRNLLGPAPTHEQIQFYSLETQVSTETPPMFLAHALNDVGVPSENNSKVLFEALQAKKISSRYLELPRGGHGLDRQSGPMWDTFQTEYLDWLMEQNYVSSVASRSTIVSTVILPWIFIFIVSIREMVLCC